MEKNPQFLKEKYTNLHTDSGVQDANQYIAFRTGEKVSNQPGVRIQNFLDRLNSILERPKDEKGTESLSYERGLAAVKRILHKKFVISPENVPESVFLLEQRLAREQGYGTLEITDEFKEKKIHEIINAQEQSLDKWVDYLASPDALYADWEKYWVIRSVLEMGKIKKGVNDEGVESITFLKRTADTVSPFPPMNPRAVAMSVEIVDAIESEKNKPKEKRRKIRNSSNRLDDNSFEKLAATESFSKIYAQFLVELPEYSADGLQEIRGKWVKYDKGSNAAPLVDSLSGYPLEWCTAAFETAQTQLQGGDFYVYYSLDQNGEAKIPRVAIRMQGNNIAEVRGIAPQQNLDPFIAPVVKEKLTEFPDGAEYEKKTKDMQTLTEIEEKVKKGKELSTKDLIFLYEVEGAIQGFGYDRDPRIDELLSTRDPLRDAPVVLKCEPNEIATDQSEITNQTKAYIGKLCPGLFGHPQIEYIYTSFPSEKIDPFNVRYLTRTPEQQVQYLSNNGVNFRQGKNHLLRKLREEQTKVVKVNNVTPQELTDLLIEDQEESDSVVILSLEEMGFTKIASVSEILKKAKKLGLELCSTELALNLSVEMLKKRMIKYSDYNVLVSSIKQSSDWSLDALVLGDPYTQDQEVKLYYGKADKSIYYSTNSKFIFKVGR